MSETVFDVFKVNGLPSVTYVERKNGALEKRLKDALNAKGQLCLVTGPSKTGKTTLYREVLKNRNEIPLIVACHNSKTCDTIWKEALEKVDFDRVQSTKRASGGSIGGEVEVSAKLNWAWLAQATAKTKAILSSTKNEEETRLKILSEPGPDILIPILRNTNYVLVIEDFHYLDDFEKKILFQKWKQFVDSEVSVIVLETSHNAIDIASNNKDLVGRIAHIDIGHWEKSDLKKICHLGFNHIGVAVREAYHDFVATEAAGLPIVVQQICQSLFTEKNLYSIAEIKKSKIFIDKKHIESCCHAVAGINYKSFETFYRTLITGPREKSRKYKTYELVLACFTLDPISFSLRRSELASRLDRLDLPSVEFPPAASINSTLGALKKFQQKREFELLEWRPSEDTLYILEPTFLFYVRWRKPKNTEALQLDLFEQLISASKDREDVDGS
ncbi:hypothetical protein AB4Z01_04165 [Inquilinus sp. YAF38]|uniref:hypothetical protein n=1 Tax=Inquilinus sp. YAF38 TaxID=3233084 RepID=UPI003F8FEBD6